MTPTEIRSLPPGREADAAFARALGYYVFTPKEVIPNHFPRIVLFDDGEARVYGSSYVFGGEPWHPSTDLGQAMAGMDELCRAKGWKVIVSFSEGVWGIHITDCVEKAKASECSESLSGLAMEVVRACLLMGVEQP